MMLTYVVMETVILHENMFTNEVNSWNVVYAGPDRQMAMSYEDREVKGVTESRLTIEVRDGADLLMTILRARGETRIEYSKSDKLCRRIDELEGELEGLRSELNGIEQFMSELNSLEEEVWEAQAAYERMRDE